jgi:lysophospholipase L1-like esterase
VGKKPRIFLGALALLGLLSLAANVVLFRKVVKQARETKRIILDPTDSLTFDIFNADLKPPPDGVVRVVFAGDSHITSWDPLPEGAGWQAINRGWGGETSGQLLLRLDRDVIGLNPAVAVIKDGSNDLECVGALPELERQIIELCKANLREIVRKLRAKNIHVVLTTIWPVGPVVLRERFFWSESIPRAIAEVNETIRGMEGPGVTVLDCDPIFAVDGAVGGRLNPAYAADMWHVNAAAYRALNEKVEPIFAKLTRQAEKR